METLSVATAAFHNICKNRKPSKTSDANPRNPTAPSCPVRRKLWEPHPPANLAVARTNLAVVTFDFLHHVLEQRDTYVIR